MLVDLFLLLMIVAVTFMALGDDDWPGGGAA